MFFNFDSCKSPFMGIINKNIKSYKNQHRRNTNLGTLKLQNVKLYELKLKKIK